jgi:hypothetical protein
MPSARLPHPALRGGAAFCKFMLSLMLMALVLPGCTVRLIGDYDATIDNGVTELHQQAEHRFATLLSTPNTPFDPNVYDELDSRLAVLKSRASSLPKYSIIIGQLGEMKAQFENLRRLDQISPRPIAPGAVTAAQSAVAVTVESILKLQTGLKRGAKPAA